MRRPSGLAVALVCLALAGAVAWFAWAAWESAHAPEPEPEQELPTHEVLVTHDSLAPTHTYDGEVIRWYVIVDPDTQVQYLVNDRGGCCARLDGFGGVMGVSYG